MVELLAPAGSREALVAAVESGANAIYLAGNMFGARAYASNFDKEGLKEAIHFAHLRGVLINVTVNTIVGDEELPALRDYLRFLYEAGADAVLVQDLGVAKIAREIVPKLPLHASTQMTVHSLEGVLALQRLGFTRVVLSRELSLREIRHICSHSQVEIEVFMHGALCVCYSGQCLMSSMIGGRSGNRGRCAQPCRLPYDLVDEKGRDLLGDSAGKYLLSPKDMNTIDLLPELIEAGVASLKIEGRMKRPEYVATVVRTYRKAIDRHYAGEGYMVTDEEHNNLAQIFNRDFTTAYLLGHPGRDIMSDRRPNNRGLMIGRVEHYDRNTGKVSVKLAGSLAVGDQVDFWVKVGGRVTADIKELWDDQGRKIAKGSAGDLVSFSLPKTVHAHDRIFKVYDAALMETARGSYKSGAPQRRITIAAEVSVAEGTPLQIIFRDMDGHESSVATDFVAEAARKRPLSEDGIRKQVDRLGTSIFALKDFSCHIEGAVMVPMSEINEARRKATEGLETARLLDLPPHNYPSMQHCVAWPSEEVPNPDKTAKLMVSVDSIEQMDAAIAGGADGILFGGESYHHKHLSEDDYIRAWDLANKLKVRFDVNTPRILRMNAQKSVENLLRCLEMYPPATVHVHNIATLALVKRLTDFPIHADYSLISYNNMTLDALKGMGVTEATLSPELSATQIKKLAKESPIPLTAIVHGRLELMVSEYCVTGCFLGSAGSPPCSQPCNKGRYYLKDRKEALFPLVMDQYCHMHVLNSKVLSMLPHAMKFLPAGLATLRIEGKHMTAEKLKQITKAYKVAMNMPSELDESQQDWITKQEGNDITRGHYFRGVL